MSDTYYDRVQRAAEIVRSRAPAAPQIGLVLGSGLGAFTQRIEDGTSIPYDTMPHWPAAGVVGHDGRLVLGRLRDHPVAVLSGRAHYYEGHDLRAVTFATRVLGALGVRVVVLTNAAGGINTSFTPGDLMVIDDHLNLIGSSPLIGPNDDRFGVRFPDMTDVYANRLRAIADEAGRSQRLTLRHGVYAACHGPSYETPAEVRYLRSIGADAVGMSTVPEAIVARHMGMEVLGISCITNLAAGVSSEPLRHDEVLETAHRVGRQFGSLLTDIIARI